MRKFGALLAGLMALGGCKGETPEEKERRELIFEAEWRLEQAARNPDRFEVRRSAIAPGMFGGQKVVCLEYNGENGFGGMSGWRRAMMIGGVVPLLDGGSSADRKTFRDAWSEARCRLSE